MACNATPTLKNVFHYICKVWHKILCIYMYIRVSVKISSSDKVYSYPEALVAINMASLVS